MDAVTGSSVFCFESSLAGVHRQLFLLPAGTRDRLLRAWGRGDLGHTAYGTHWRLHLRRLRLDLKAAADNAYPT